MFMMGEGCTEEDYNLLLKCFSWGNSALLLQAGLCLYVFMQA